VLRLVVHDMFDWDLFDMSLLDGYLVLCGHDFW
jgi:hypothetical protein